MLQSSLIQSRESFCNFLQIVLLDFIGPNDSLLTFDSIDELFIALKIDSTLLHFIENGITHSNSTTLCWLFIVVQLETELAKRFLTRNCELLLGLLEFQLQIIEGR